MALLPTTLSSDLYSLFKSMSGYTNQKFADDFSDVINDWYKEADGLTIDGGLLTSGAFLGSGHVDSIDSNSSLCSTIILTCCNLIDNTKPSNAKTLFAECIAKGIVTMVNASKIKCKVNGAITQGTTSTDVTNADSEGHITIFDSETEIPTSDYEMEYSDYIKLPSNLKPNSISIKYTYNDINYTSSDDGEGTIDGQYINGTVDYTKGDVELTLEDDREIDTIKLSYTFTSNFKGDVLEVLNSLEVQHDETENEWKTRLNGDADKYFADNLAQIITTQITSVVLTTYGKGDIVGSMGVGKLF